MLCVLSLSQNQKDFWGPCLPALFFFSSFSATLCLCSSRAAAGRGGWQGARGRLAPQGTVICGAEVQAPAVLHGASWKVPQGSRRDHSSPWRGYDALLVASPPLGHLQPPSLRLDVLPEVWHPTFQRMLRPLMAAQLSPTVAHLPTCVRWLQAASLRDSSPGSQAPVPLPRQLGTLGVP